MRILTVNTGSTSVKLERYDLTFPLPPIADPPQAAYRANETTSALTPATLAAALREPIDAIAHRFVQLPPDAAAITRLDPNAIAQIRAASSDDRLHDAPALDAVETFRRARPDVAQFAVSDSAFHRTLSAAATTYALPAALTGTTLHRIGYHGLSHEYAAHRGCALSGLDAGDARVVTVHLGGGSSLCAVRAGTSIDTTMGYTPLEGLPMATRSGSVDPGLLLHLVRNGMNADDLEDALARHGGLAGISGLSGDMRELFAAAPRDTRAQLALDVLAWRLRASLGAMIAGLGGVDLIVFTGGIGEHAPFMRAAGLAGGLGLGITLDQQLNETGVEGRIDRSGVPVAIVAARENWQLARAIAAQSN